MVILKKKNESEIFRLENMGKEEIDGYQHLLLFSQCFQTLFFQGH